MRRWLRSVLPVMMFAAALVLIQWTAGMPVTSLALKAVLVFLCASLLVRLIPWRRWIFACRPGSHGYLLVLFGLFVRHFAGILTAEARRVLVARRFAVPHARGRGAIRSLGHATASVLLRSLARAERFYAAQSLRGIAE